jgi:hypothetical protein
MTTNELMDMMLERAADARRSPRPDMAKGRFLSPVLIGAKGGQDVVHAYADAPSACLDLIPVLRFGLDVDVVLMGVDSYFLEDRSRVRSAEEKADLMKQLKARIKAGASFVEVRDEFGLKRVLAVSAVDNEGFHVKLRAYSLEDGEFTLLDDVTEDMSNIPEGASPVKDTMLQAFAHRTGYTDKEVLSVAEAMGFDASKPREIEWFTARGALHVMDLFAEHVICDAWYNHKELIDEPLTGHLEPYEGGAELPTPPVGTISNEHGEMIGSLDGGKPLKSKAEADAAEKVSLEKNGFYVHISLNDPTVPTGFNAHTHGFPESFGHRDIQLVAPGTPENVETVFRELADYVKKGKKLVGGRTYKDVLDGLENFQFLCVPAIESGREVFRIILPNMVGSFDPANMEGDHAEDFAKQHLMLTPANVKQSH